MKYLKYYLFILIFLLVPNCYALEYNMNNKTSASLNGTKNRYLGTEIYNTGTTNTYTFGTRYNGKLSAIETYFDYPFEANTTYTLTYNMNTEDFRNNFGGKYWWDCTHTMNAVNQHVGTFTYVSYKKVKFTFTPTENTTCIRVLLGSTNLSLTAITGVSNWRLDSITLYDPDYQSGSGGGQGSTPTPTPTPAPNSNQDIINNQNNNTQDIINNNNQNTSDIIENNNSNTQDIINNQNENTTNNILIESNNARQQLVSRCSNGYYFELKKGFSINSSNQIVEDSNSYYVEDYIPIHSGSSSLTIADSTITTVSGNFILLYDSNKNLLDYFFSNNRIITLPSGTSYFRLSSIRPTFMVYDGRIGCISKIDQNTNAINEVNDTLNDTNNYLKDDTNPNINNNEITSLFSNVGYTDPLNYLLQLPTMLINKLVSLSDSCQSINFGTLLGSPIIFPCINLENIIGSSVWNTIDVICTVGLLVVIFKNLYQTFANLMTMGGEKEAREKFNMPTPMEFLSYVLGGDK